MDSKKSMNLKVMYCSDLKAFNFFQKLQVYVLVSLVSNDPEKKLKQKQQHRTTTDAEDDENPEWNHEMQFDLSEVSFVDSDHLFIHFDLYHEGLYFGDKIIGEVRVPLKDLIQESSGILRFANYQVRSPDGKPNGILNFSYKINVMANDLGINSTTSQITGYSVVVHHHHQSPENPYPSSEVENSNSSHTSYPSLQLQNNFQEMHPTVAPVTYPPHETHYSSQETHYPPTSYGYYPPPLPHHLPLPPPPPACGACYPPPYPPGFRPCCPGEVYGYGPCGACNSTGRQPYNYGGRWRHDSHGYR